MVLYRDMVLREGDIDVSASGTFVTTVDEELLAEAVLRRLMTPPNIYTKWVRRPLGQSDELALVDENYENKVFSYLSEPLSATLAEKVRSAILESAQQESRIQVINVEPVTSRLIGAPQRVHLEISYTMLDFDSVVSRARIG